MIIVMNKRGKHTHIKSCKKWIRYKETINIIKIWLGLHFPPLQMFNNCCEATLVVVVLCCHCTVWEAGFIRMNKHMCTMKFHWYYKSAMVLHVYGYLTDFVGQAMSYSKPDYSLISHHCQ